jgi:hypothetical protein
MTNSLIQNNRNNDQQPDLKNGNSNQHLIQNNRKVTNSLLQNNGNSNQEPDPK